MGFNAELNFLWKETKVLKQKFWEKKPSTLSNGVLSQWPQWWWHTLSDIPVPVHIEREYHVTGTQDELDVFSHDTGHSLDSSSVASMASPAIHMVCVCVFWPANWILPPSICPSKMGRGHFFYVTNAKPPFAMPTLPPTSLGKRGYVAAGIRSLMHGWEIKLEM